MDVEITGKSDKSPGKVEFLLKIKKEIKIEMIDNNGKTLKLNLNLWEILLNLSFSNIWIYEHKAPIPNSNILD